MLMSFWRDALLVVSSPWELNRLTSERVRDVMPEYGELATDVKADVVPICVASPAGSTSRMGECSEVLFIGLDKMA